MKPNSLIAVLLAFANQLKFKTLFIIVSALFITDLLVPDVIPFIDEIILGLMAIVLANWKKESTQKKNGDLIEGEVVEEENK